VATPSVNIGVDPSAGLAKDLTSPKSQSLIEQFEFMRMLDGFRSLWIIKPECKYFKALASW